MPLVEQELLTIPEHPSSPPVFSVVRVRSLVLCAMCCRSLFVLLCFFFWPLCCLYFFDLWNLITFFWIFKTLFKIWMKMTTLYTNCWISFAGITTVILIVIFLHIPSVYEFARYIWSIKCHLNFFERLLILATIFHTVH